MHKHTDRVVIRVSPNMGHFKTYWVAAENADGWVCCVEAADGHTRVGLWFSPKHVIHRERAAASYDYNDIQPTTLVEAMGSIGMVISRKSSNYEIMVSGEVRLVDWRYVVPIPCDASGA